MKTDNHNDWTDIFRESFPEEERPAAGGWEAVAGRMRRAAARRRAAVAAAVLALPVAGGLLFLLPHGDAPAPTDAAPVSVIEATGTPRILADVPATVEPSLPASDILREMPEGSARERDILREMPEGSAQEHGILREMPEGSAREHDILREMPEGSTREHDILREKPEGSASGEAGTPRVPEAIPDGSPFALSDFEGSEGSRKAPAHRLSVGINAGSTAAGASTSLTTTSMAGGISTKAGSITWNNTSGVILQHEYIHDLPKSLGVSARYTVGERISLESGIEFTRLHSRLDDLHSVMTFAGIPLRMDIRLFKSGPAEVYAGIGAEAEKCLKASFGGIGFKEPKIQWSGSAFVGAQTRIAGSAWLYLQPELSYYFTKTTLVSYRTENRLGITLSAGLRFDIAGSR